MVIKRIKGRNVYLIRKEVIKLIKESGLIDLVVVMWHINRSGWFNPKFCFNIGCLNIDVTH